MAWSVGRSVTIVSPAKTAEPIEMPFGKWTWVIPKNHVFDGVRIPMEMGNFDGEGDAIGNTVHVRRRACVFENIFRRLHRL